MCRLFRVLGVGGWVLVAGLWSRSAAADPVRIGIIGDQTASYDLDASYAVLQQGVTLLQGQSLNGVLHVGDLVESTQPPDQVTARFNQAVGILNGLGVPWYLTPGDHDVDPPPPWVPDSTDRSRETLFQGLYAGVNPSARSHLYYSVDVVAGSQKYHFIALDALEHLNTDPRWGDVFFAGLSAEQQQWLKVDLDANRDAAATVVWLHQPLWYNWSTWAPVHELLADYHVSAVIAGHFHYNQTEGEIDGVSYRVVGATGGLVKTATPYAGGAQHVTVMTLDGPAVSFTVLPIGGAEPTSFTPRYDMDRVQALSYILDNLYSFWPANPVSLLDGQPVSSCSAGTPATLTLSQVGNAIDIPADLSVTFASDVTSLSSSHFDAADCDPGSPAGECLLPANANVSLSNTSIATANTYTPEDLWEATLAGTGANQAGTATLTASFTYVSPVSNLSLGISSTVATAVTVCTQPEISRSEKALTRYQQREAEKNGTWVAVQDGVERPAQVEFSGGPGLGRVAVAPSAVRTANDETSILLGADVRLLEQPNGVMPESFTPPPEASSCQHFACLGSGIPNAPGALLCCDTGTIVGKCMGSWPCSEVASAPRQ